MACSLPVKVAPLRPPADCGPTGRRPACATAHTPRVEPGTHLLVVERGHTDRRHDGGQPRSLPAHAAMLGVSPCCGTGQKVPDRPGRRTDHKGRSFMTIAVVRQAIRLWVGRRRARTLLL